MRIILVLFMCLIVCFYCKSQTNTYTTAMKIARIENAIKNYIDTGRVSLSREIEELTKSKDFTKSLLQSDFWELDSIGITKINSYCEIILDTKNDPEKTPLLSEIFGYEGGLGPLSTARSGNQNNDTKSFLGGIPSEAVIIQGITNFVAKRFKAEIELAFFRKFRNFLTANTSMGALYPKTVQIFTYDNVLGMEQFSGALRSAFIVDLKDLHKNLVKEIETPSVGGWFEKQNPNPQVKDLFLTGCKYIASLQDGKNPKLSLEKILQTKPPYATPFLEIIGIYMRELMVKEKWVSSEAFSDSMNNLFSALLYSQNPKLFKNTNVLDKQFYIKKSKEFVYHLSTFTDAIGRYELGNRMNTLSAQDYFKYLDEYNNFLELAATMLDHNGNPALSKLRGIRNLNESINSMSVVKLSKELLQNILEMQLNSKQDNYSLVVFNTNFILRNLYNNFNTNDGSDKKIKAFGEILPKLLLYGTFIAEFAASKNEKDIENLLSRFAMPPGGYSVKNKAPISLMIDSYVGANFGVETIKKNKTDRDYSSSGFVSLFAPIGIELSFKLKKGNIGVFVPIIDIGAPLSFRLGTASDSLKVLPELSFKNIIAPGAFIKYGFANSSLSILVGAKLAPRLRKKDGDILFEANSSWRYGIGIAMDLTLFKLLVSK